MRHFWIDDRLTFTKQHNLSELTLAEDFVEKIWIPDTYFINGEQITFHKSVSSDNVGRFRLRHDGRVHFSTRYVKLDFLDVQICHNSGNKQIEMSIQLIEN